MNTSDGAHNGRKPSNQNIQVYVRVRPTNARERMLRSLEVINTVSAREIETRHSVESKHTKKFIFDRVFGQESRQTEVYSTVVAPLIEEVLAGYNCTVFAYGQTGTGKTHTMVGTECAELRSSWEDDSEIGIIPRALCHLFDELRLMELEFSMRISYLELYNEELCDLLSTDDSIKIRIFDDATKKGSVIIQGLEEIPVHSKDDVYKLLEKGKERRKTATTLMNAQSSRSHTVFSILVHIRENGLDGEEMLKIGKLNLVDLAGSENATKAGSEKGIRVREAVNINQSLLTLGRVITALVERTPHIPYRESKLTRLLQESLGGRTKTSIIATISPGHKDIEETLSTLQYADRAKNIQNKPEVNQKLTKRIVLKEYTEEIDKLKRDLMAARDKNGIYLAEQTYNEMTYKMDSQTRELNEKMLLLKALKDEMQSKERLFNEVSLNLVEKTTKLLRVEEDLKETKGVLVEKKKALKNTKRRYKEKKQLIESHVKTEEQLINQATQILEVADTATKDAHKLHHTIERRKNVERQIKNACEKFTGRMRDNFEISDNHLDQLRTQHQWKIDLVNEELNNGIKMQKQLHHEANANLECIQQNLKVSFAESMVLNEKYVKLFEGLSDQQYDALLKFIEEQKQINILQNNSIHKSILALTQINIEQTATVDHMQKHISHVLDASTNEMKTYINTLKQNIASNISLLEANENINANIRAKVDEEYAILKEEKILMDEMFDRMKMIRERRAVCADNIVKLSEQLTDNRSQVHASLQCTSDVASLFYDKRSQDNEALKKQLSANVNQIVSNVNKITDECSKLEINVAEVHDNCSKKMDAEIETINMNRSQALAELKKHHTETENSMLANESKLEEACLAAGKGIKQFTHKITLQLTRSGALGVDLKEIVDAYSKSYQKHVANSKADIENFKMCELKTYAPTGTTPSKRDFVYPRVLATTAPHNQIIKRVRQENDWSDLDTTATIDEEESDFEEDDRNTEVLSVQGISDADTVLNSTPLMVNNKSLQSSNSTQNSEHEENYCNKENM